MKALAWNCTRSDPRLFGRKQRCLGGVNDHFTFVIRVSKAIALHEFRRYELKVDFNFNKFSVKIQRLKQHSWVRSIYPIYFSRGESSDKVISFYVRISKFKARDSLLEVRVSRRKGLSTLSTYFWAVLYGWLCVTSSCTFPWLSCFS